MDEICKKQNCVGCMACMNICPKKAITIETNRQGFSYPKINPELCVDCKLCQQVCPMTNQEIRDAAFKSPVEAYLGKNELSVRMRSSSGGMFHAFASVILANHGVVYGAGFSKDQQIVHMRVDNMDDLTNLMGSKYAQSQIGNIYSDVYEQLTLGKKVYFSGTPCQVSGLLLFLEQKKCDTAELITQDFVCHGVGSPRFYQDYLQELEQKYHSKAVRVNFRGKPKAGKLQNMMVRFENGKQFTAVSTNEDIYYYHFLNNLILRPSCFECQYTKSERQADLTLADCFTIKENDVRDDGRGMSYLQINTKKGQRLLREINQEVWTMEVDQRKYVQPNMKKPTQKPGQYDAFWKTYETSGYREATKIYGNRNFKHACKRLVLYVLNKLEIMEFVKKIKRKRKS